MFVVKSFEMTESEAKFFFNFVQTFLSQRKRPREVVVAQLAEQSLTIPEDPGSIPVIGNFY